MANAWIEHVKKYAAKHKIPTKERQSLLLLKHPNNQKGRKQKEKVKLILVKISQDIKGNVSKSKGKDVKIKKEQKSEIMKAPKKSLILKNGGQCLRNPNMETERVTRWQKS